MEQVLDLLEIHIRNPWVLGLIKSGFIGLVFFVFLLLSKRFVTPIIHRYVSDEKIIRALLRLVRKIVILVGLSLIIGELPLPPELGNIIANVIFIVVAFFVILGLFDVSNIAGLFVRSRAPEFEILVTRILRIVAATVVLMVTMRHFNYDIWHIMTALGVGTLAVGLAAQPTLTNMIAGFTILIDRPFRRGDRVALSTGETGDVVHIGMRSTHILTIDGNMLIVSNSELVNTRLVNFSFPSMSMGYKVKFYVDHNGSLQSVKEILRSIAATVEGVIKESIKVYLTGTNDWGTEITVFFNVESFTETAKISDALIDAAILEFHKKNIRLATSPLPPPRT